MVRLVAFDFILGLVFAGVVRISFVRKIRRMDFNDDAGYIPRFGVPPYMIANFKFPGHGLKLREKEHKTRCAARGGRI